MGMAVLPANVAGIIMGVCPPLMHPANRFISRNPTRSCRAVSTRSALVFLTAGGTNNLVYRTWYAYGRIRPYGTSDYGNYDIYEYGKHIR